MGSLSTSVSHLDRQPLKECNTSSRVEGLKGISLPTIASRLSWNRTLRSQGQAKAQRDLAVKDLRLSNGYILTEVMMFLPA